MPISQIPAYLKKAVEAAGGTIRAVGKTARTVDLALWERNKRLEEEAYQTRMSNMDAILATPAPPQIGLKPPRVRSSDPTVPLMADQLAFLNNPQYAPSSGLTEAQLRERYPAENPTLELPTYAAQPGDFASVTPQRVHATNVPEEVSMNSNHYKDGGFVGPGGERIPPMQPAGIKGGPQQPGQMMDAKMMDQQISQSMQSNPQGAQQIKQAIEQAIQTGELTPRELNMMVQLAKTVVQNPQMYPRVRQFAIQQGLGTEQDIPQEYDEGLVATILMIGQTMQAQGQQAQPGAPQATGQAPVAAMKDGGSLPSKSRNPDGSIPIVAHEGEYVIPKHIVLQKGTDFFDKMINPDAGKAK